MRARFAGLILLMPLCVAGAPALAQEQQAQLAWRTAQGDELLRLGPQRGARSPAVAR
jgi:hypothetical protein